MISKIMYLLKGFLKSKSSAVEHLIVGNMLLATQEYEHAIKEYTISISINPSFDEPYVMRSYCYWDLGEYDLVLKDRDKAISLNPKNVEAHVARGNYYTKIRDYENAFLDYDAAIKLYENEEDNSFHAQQIREKFNGKELNKKILELNREDIFEAYFRRGQILNMKASLKFDKEVINKAIQDFKKSLEIKPFHSYSYMGLGQSYELLGNLKLALLNHMTANNVSDTPTDRATASNFLARILIKLDEIDEAERYLDEGIELDPNYYALYLNRGVCYCIRGLKEKALKDFEKCLEINPDCEEAKQNIIEIKKSKKKLLSS